MRKKYRAKNDLKNRLFRSARSTLVRVKGQQDGLQTKARSRPELMAELTVLRKLAGALTVYQDPKTHLFTVSKELLQRLEIPLQKTSWKFGELVQWIHKDDLDRLNIEVAQAIESSEAIDIEFRLQIPNGTVRWIRCHSVFRNNDPAGRLPSYWAIQDVTQSKFAVSDMRRQLEVSNKRLVQINQSLTAFAYALSHDLKRPIRHVHSYCDLLVEAIGSADYTACSAYLTKITGAAKGMSELIDKMLSFSQVGSRALELEKIDHQKIITEILAQVNAHSELNVSWSFEGDCNEVVADVVLWRTLWINLIDNAIKYSQINAFIELKFDCSNVVNGVRCLISDNGIGFDMTQTTQMFEVFQRLTSDNRFAGHGIGLAQARRIVEAHGGIITTTSMKGHGATFCVLIPTP